MSRREFQLVEGASSKFWTIELDGNAHTVHFGRIGTAGQTARKEFASETEATTAHDKLVAEKIKKGYREVGAASASSVAQATTSKPEPATPRAKGSARKPKAGAGEPASEVASQPESVRPPEPVTVPVPEPELVMVVERSIDLASEDWFWATGHAHAPLARPEPKPFDLEEGLERLSKVKVGSYSWSWDWSKVPIPSVMSREEANFWLTVLFLFDREMKPNSLVDLTRNMMRVPDTTAPNVSDVLVKLNGWGGYAPATLLDGLVAHMPISEMLDVLNQSTQLHQSTLSSLHHEFAVRVRRFVLPYLTESEVSSAREQVRAKLDPPALPTNHYTAFPLPWYLAAALGLHDEVRGLVRLIPDTHYGGGADTWNDHYQRPQLLVLGLGDARLIETEWRRLNLRHNKTEYITGWLATTEYAALDVVRDSILAQSNKDECASLMTELARVKAPEVAGPMLELMLGSKAPKVARQWLDENTAHAIAGLIPVAAGRGKVADAALEYVRDQNKKGRGASIRKALESATPDVADRVRRDVLERVEVIMPRLDDATTPERIAAAMAGASALKPPSWVSASDLPNVVIASRILNEGQAKTFLAALTKSKLGEPHAVVQAVKAHADSSSLDAYAWSLFERWLVEGAPSKDKWAMTALGLIGSDASAMKLTPLVRAWPGESQHQRAVVGLECLRAIGSDVALMQLNGIAQKLSFKGLKAKAAEFMEAIAHDRKLSRAQLEDRIVPDCDLDDRGSRVFDFGPRQFRFVLGTEMKPMVRDPDGKLKTDLPKPGAKDDPVLAGAALDAWKLLKKQVKEVAKVQAERLEQAMVTGRRWTPADFESLLVRHPLMTNLVRLLLWGGYDASGKLIATFRVTEERDYADVDESAFALDGLAKVGVVHALHLSDADKSAWGEIFGDYEIIPPFPQLGRASHKLEPEEETVKELTRNKGLKIPSITLVGILDRHGWLRGIPEDGGVFHEHTKAFEGANVTAVIQYPGIPVGMMVDWEDQEVESCFFVPGIYTPKMYPDHNKALPLGSVDTVVISEVLGTLGALAAKAK
jgi:predicted DNA-binding WGR domain protein